MNLEEKNKFLIDELGQLKISRQEYIEQIVDLTYKNANLLKEKFRQMDVFNEVYTELVAVRAELDKYKKGV